MRIFKVFLVVCSLFLIRDNCQAQRTFWQKFFGGEGFDMGKEVIIRKDGTLVIAGECYSKEVLRLANHQAGNSDVLLFKYSTQGLLFWKLLLGGTGMDELSQLIETKDGGYAFIGTTDTGDGTLGTAQGGSDMWVCKLDDRGKVLWSKTFGGKGNDRGYALVETPDGGLMIGGESGSDEGNMRSPHHGRLDAWVAMLGSDGKLIWEKHYGGSNHEQVKRIHRVKNDEYLIIGTSDSHDGDVAKNIGGKDVWMFLLNDYGEMKWQASYGGTANDDVYGSEFDAIGNLYLAGTTFSEDYFIGEQKGKGDFWVQKLDPTRSVLWSQTFGGSMPDGANDLYPTQDGGVVICGMTRSQNGDVYINNGYYDGFVVKLDATGQKQWIRSFGHIGKDGLQSIVEAPEGGYLALGFLEEPSKDRPVPGQKVGPDIPISGHGGSYDIWFINFSDPARAITRPYLTPPVLSGIVLDKNSDQPLEAEITLTDNSTLDSLNSVIADVQDGAFQMLLPAYGLVSINVSAKGFIFYGEDLLMDTLVEKSSITRKISLEPIRIGSSLILDKIYFQTGKWDLLPTSRAELERLIKFLNLNPRVVILISGHTDNTGNREQKMKLSENRANSVRKYLVDRGISPNRMRTKGYGMYRPIAPNTSEEGRRRNRRVEFEVLNK